MKAALLFAMLTMGAMSIRQQAQIAVYLESVQEHANALAEMTNNEQFTQAGLSAEDVSSFARHVKAIEKFVSASKADKNLDTSADPCYCFSGDQYTLCALAGTSAPKCRGR